MNWAAVPKTAVYEDRQPRRWKHKVRIAEDGSPTTPTGDAVLSKNRDQAEFGRRIAAAFYPRHDLGALLL